jgi:GNAT superfamily N-acetyltransferase
LPTSSSARGSERTPIPEDVRRFAEAPGAWGAIPPESGLTRFLTERYCLLLGPVPSFTTVSRLRLDPDEVPETLAEVRALVAERGHREALWWVDTHSTPADLVDRLTTHGLVPHSERHAAALVLVDQPPPSPPELVARRVETFEEFCTAEEIARAAFGTSAEEAAEWERVAAERWEAERAGFAPRAYLAFLDGEPVGVGRGLVQPDCPAVLMIGGGVLPRARGRGAYRALVRARWDDAVAAGTPALAVNAGPLSRPILERIGFQPVSEIEILLDP